MSAKQFFKGTAFKCIAVLLGITVICSAILTICNSLFYVSAEERFQRAVSKLYGETVEYTELEVDKTVNVTSAEINSIYEITTESYVGDYLLNVKGKGGYGGGSVTCWIIVNVDLDAQQINGIRKATIASNVGQSYISKIKDSAIDALINEQTEGGFTEYEVGDIKTGASFSMGAIANALNAARSYVNQAICSNLPKYAGYKYHTYIADETEITVNNGVVTYNVVTKTSISLLNAFNLTITVDDSKKVTSCTLVTDGSSKASFTSKMIANIESFITGKSIEEIEAVIEPVMTNGEYDDSRENTDGVTICTGATRSNFMCLYAAAFATANYDHVIALNGQGGN